MGVKAEIYITGIVQGVGFRPFVYRIANELSLVGYVMNLGDAGVKILVEGQRKNVELLIDKVKNRPPSISRVDSLSVKWKEEEGEYDSFIIEKSVDTRDTNSAPVIPPDIAICENCLGDLTDCESRWFRYPFTSCAACGPRFSTITGLPYDRPYTTMNEFPLCSICNTGYTSPLDRRYHAQTTACEYCGPLYSLLDSKGMQVKDVDPIKHTQDLLKKGAIVALQGISGTHLVTITSDPQPIRTLRVRKKRSNRPFAVMAKNDESIYNFAVPTKIEIAAMSSWRKPIVLLKKKSVLQVLSKLAEDSLEEISPGLDTIGVMLPYSPLHHLLFEDIDEHALVMTSANPIGIPMYIQPRTIVSELHGIADYFLVHNRRIHQRADDSVIKYVMKDSPVFIRRARGYVPEPIKLEYYNGNESLISLGPEEKATGAALKSGNVYLTQYIGDTNRVENIEFLGGAIQHIRDLLGMRAIDGVACDLHPEFLSTELAEEITQNENVPLVRVQHHHAHLSSLLVDNSLSFDTSIVCITADGYGFAPDGTGWGGEILLGNAERVVRKGGLMQQIYPGGDMSARFAVRALTGILADELGTTDLSELIVGAPISSRLKADLESVSLLVESVKKKLNVLTSTSTGRFLDAAAALLGVCMENSYDGECPMKLEAVSKKNTITLDPIYIESSRGTELDTTQSMLGILNLKKQGVSSAEIAYVSHRHLGEALAEIACSVAHDEGTRYVGFSGGVALNRILTKTIVDYIKSQKLTPVIHRRLPPGDGGISAGQIATAVMQL